MAEALEAAAERGVDISGLRSSTLDPAVVTGSDVVLTMTAEQREEVLSAVPDAGPKTFTLKELVRLLAALPPAAPGAGREAALDRIRDANRIRATGEAVVGDEDVSDPLGMSVDTYRAVAWEIEGLVDELLSGLFGSPRPEPAGEAKRVWG
jgi:protein-tyrosine phosphatase